MSSIDRIEDLLLRGGSTTSLSGIEMLERAILAHKQESSEAMDYDIIDQGLRKGDADLGLWAVLDQPHDASDLDVDDASRYFSLLAVIAAHRSAQHAADYATERLREQMRSDADETLWGAI